MNVEDALNQLLNEDNITAARKLADEDERIKKLTTEEYNHVRRRCKTELFFLCKSILGFTKLSKNLHGHYCTWHMMNRTQRFRGKLLPRGHYKTTIGIGDSIRIVLPDDVGDCPHPENLGTNARVLLGHEVVDRAAEQLYGIQLQVLSNPLLMGFFPEIIPSPKKHRINRYQLELPRTERWAAPTFGTIGVGGRSQGMHFNFLKMDDLIGDKARDSIVEMDGAKLWFDNIQSFFVDFDEDHLDIDGTRWGVNDLYAHVMDVYEEQMIWYIRPAEEYVTEIDEDGKEQRILKPIFPEQFSTKSFAIIKKRPEIWNAQYANNPELIGRKLLPEWLRYFEWLPSKQTPRVVTFEGDKREIHEIWDMDRVVLCDPAMSGEAGILVTGSTRTKHFTLEVAKSSWDPRAFIEYIFQLVLKWKPRLVSIEEVLFSGLFKPWIEDEMKKRKIYFTIMPFKVGKVEKEARVMGLASYYSENQIWHHRAQTDLIDEYMHFGTGAKYHLLDALSQGPHIWVKPLTNKQKIDRQKIEAALLDQRDAITGY